MSYIDERAKRKGIAKAVTNQCGIVGKVSLDDITIVDQTLGMTLGMETIDVEFTINGKDGDVFCAKLTKVMYTRYCVVGVIRMKEPEPKLYDHTVYVVSGGFGVFNYGWRELSIVGTKLTRGEWMNWLYVNGTIDTRQHFTASIVTYNHSGHPIFDCKKTVIQYVSGLNCVIDVKQPKLTMHDIWSIMPISKEPTLLNTIAATSFKEATRKLHNTSGYGTTVVHGEVHYNDRPVFPTQEAAKNWLALCSFSNAAISAGNLMAEISKNIAANAKKMSEEAPKRTRPDTKTYSIWGVEDNKPTKLGDEHATTFERALRQFWNNCDTLDDNMRSGNIANIGKYTYLGHPVFESESEAQAYIYAEVKPKPRKVTELPCFKSVSDVIGKQSAMCALFKVMNTPDCHLDLDNPNIVYAFNWIKTPQGNDYWYGVSTLIQFNMEEARKHIYVDLNSERDFVMPGCSFGVDLANSPDESVYFTVSVPKNRK